MKRCRYNNRNAIVSFYSIFLISISKVEVVYWIVHNRRVSVHAPTPVYDLVHSLIQHYIIKFVTDLRQVGVFLRVFRFPPPIDLTTTIQLYTSSWTGFELTTLVVTGSDCIGSYKSNYHTIMTMTTRPNVIELLHSTNVLYMTLHKVCLFCGIWFNGWVNIFFSETTHFVKTKLSIHYYLMGLYRYKIVIFCCLDMKSKIAKVKL
jgi:hypothetical protein